MTPRTPNPDLLVDPAWLEARLDDPTVRCIDCTATLIPQKVGPSHVESGLPAWREGHIPGSTYLHMKEDLSAPSGYLPYNLPSPEHMTQLLAGIGINQNDTVVLYGATYPAAVTRAWWVLKASGVHDVRILDGGWHRWTAEKRPVSLDTPIFTRGDFHATPVPELVADADAVERAIADPDAILINALSQEQFLGTGGARYGRPGRIPCSVNIPTRDLIDPATQCYVSFDELERICTEAGALDVGTAIAYCGGGIAASATVFVLALLGHPNASLYDRSLLEWASQPERPMERG